jgi:hypothetical protein
MGKATHPGMQAAMNTQQSARYVDAERQRALLAQSEAIAAAARAQETTAKAVAAIPTPSKSMASGESPKMPLDIASVLLLVLVGVVGLLLVDGVLKMRNKKN